MPASATSEGATSRTFSCFRPISTLEGVGASDSSARLAVGVVEDIIASGRTIRSSDEVIREVLLREEARADGAAVAAQDVALIVKGRVARVETEPDQAGIAGRIRVLPIRGAGQFLEAHTLLAVKDRGHRHRVSSALGSVWSHPERVAFVRRCTELSDRVAHGLHRRDLSPVCLAVDEYRTLFDRWTAGQYLRFTQDIGRRLERRFGRELGWKPPGAGAASSILLIVRDPTAIPDIRHLLAKEGWLTMPVLVSAGLRIAPDERSETYVISAPHRLDLIGAADLGRDIRIMEPGRCVGMAIEPRATRIVRPVRTLSSIRALNALMRVFYYDASLRTFG